MACGGIGTFGVTVTDTVQGIDSTDRLARWFRETGIFYIVLDTQRLCDALSLEEMEAFQQLIFRYTEACTAAGINATDDDWQVRAKTPPGRLSAPE